MTEQEWTNEEVAPPKKGIPFWVWGCGGSCLLAVVLVIAFAVFAFDKAKDAVDPDVVWPKVGEILAFEERPHGYQAFGGTLGGGGAYVIMVESKKLMGVIVLSGSEDEEELDKLFSGEIESDGAFGIGGIKNAESLDITIKGKSYRAVHFEATSVGGPAAAHADGDVGSILLIDLSPDPSRFVMLELFDLSGDVTDQADVDVFMEPFTPWG